MALTGIVWGEDLERDCLEMRKLASWGLYAKGHHDANCPIHNLIWIGEYDSLVETNPDMGVPLLTIKPMSELLVQKFAENTAPDVIYFFVNLSTDI